MNNKPTLYRGIILLLLIMLLAGCGGSDGGGDSSSSEPVSQSSDTGNSDTGGSSPDGSGSDGSGLACSGLPKWEANTAYTSGDKVRYEGQAYQANWWTQGDRPDKNAGGTGSGEPWTRVGSCPNGSAGGSSSDGSGSGSDHSSAGNNASQLPADLAQAVETGDPSAFTGIGDAAFIAEQTYQYMQGMLLDKQTERIRAIYGGASPAYNPGGQSQLLRVLNFRLAQPLITGDGGHVLAAISVAHDGRSAAYGDNILAHFSNGENTDRIPVFKRLLAWLVTGNASHDLSTITIGAAGIDGQDVQARLQQIGIDTSLLQCKVLADAGCAGKADLLVFGSSGPAGAGLTNTLAQYLQAGIPVLYLHTINWEKSPFAKQVLAAMALQLGPYGGNFWINDSVSPGRDTSEVIRANNQFKGLMALFKRLKSGNFITYDYSNCTSTDCYEVAGLSADILAPARLIRHQLNRFNRQAKKLFATPGTTLLRLCSLWADAARQQINYPLSWSGSQAAFQKALIADAWVTYVRETGLDQPDLGSFMDPGAANLLVSTTFETITITLPNESGFTAIGRMAVPGKKMVIELVDGGSADLAFRLNTQRTGSTRWGTKHEYTRPRFLASPDIQLTEGDKVPVVTPYGGTLQLVFDHATPGQKVTLRVKGVVKHPFLDMTQPGGGQIGQFLRKLNANKYDWAEIKLKYAQIHAKSDMLREVISNKFNGDGHEYVHEIRNLLIKDAYKLAGFNLPRDTLPSGVLTFCQNHSWDCTDASIHRVPDIQHFNVDLYAHCGYGCGGNPIDLGWPLNPRGWGESHELGHELQVDALRIYGGRTNEVSNQLFPLHKDRRMYVAMGINRDKDRVAYKKAFMRLKQCQDQYKPSDCAYDKIWKDPDYAANNGMRMAFYLQWVHYWADQPGVSQDEAWNIYTLLYLHARLLKHGEKTWDQRKYAIGYGSYASQGDIDNGAYFGNDNMLIALSLITGHDQRPTFDLWGIDYSDQASQQVAALGLPKQPAFYYANTTTNDYSNVQIIDMTQASPTWPY